MTAFKVGEYTFYECNVAFHFRRDNVYSPWVAIGVYYTAPKFQGARYLNQYLDIEDAFYRELNTVDSEYIRGGPEFLESWAKRYHGATDVISPVINYCTTYRGEFRDLLIHLFTKYVGSCSPSSFAMLTIMIKMRKRYFPALFKDGKDRDNFTKVINEAGIL